MLSNRLSTAAAVPVLLALSFAAPADTDGSRRRESKLTPEASLQRSLRGVLAELNLNHYVSSKHLAVSLVDVTDMSHPRYAGINDTEMMYAASLPKICPSNPQVCTDVGLQELKSAGPAEYAAIIALYNKP